jgi:hypothetical protein
MILADLLYDASNLVLIEASPLADLCRMVIAVVSAMTAVLLAKLYLSHRTGRMSLLAGVGAVSTYVVVAWAQLIAVSAPGPQSDLTALNLGVLTAVSLSLAGVLQAMNVHLFSRSEPQPGRLDRAIAKLDSMSDKLDAIDHAVNTRDKDDPTISDDVRALREDFDARKQKGPE